MADNPLEQPITGDELIKLISFWDGNTGDNLVNLDGRPNWKQDIEQAVSILKSNKLYEQLQADPEKSVPIMALFSAGMSPEAQQAFIETKGPEAFASDPKSPIVALRTLQRWNQYPPVPEAPKDISDALRAPQYRFTKDHIIRILGETAMMDANYKLISGLPPEYAAIYRKLVNIVNDPSIAHNQIIPDLGEVYPLIDYFARTTYNPEKSQNILTPEVRSALTINNALKLFNLAVAARKNQKEREEKLKAQQEAKEAKELNQKINEANAAAQAAEAARKQVLEAEQEAFNKDIQKQANEQEAAASEAAQLAAEQSPAKPQSMPTAEEIETRIQKVEDVYNNYHKALATGDDVAINAALAAAKAMNLTPDLLNNPSKFLEEVEEAREMIRRSTEESEDEITQPTQPKSTAKEEASATKNAPPASQQQVAKAAQVGAAFQGMAQAVQGAKLGRAEDLARRIENYQAGKPDPQDVNFPLEKLLNEYRIFARKEWSPSNDSKAPSPVANAAAPSQSVPQVNAQDEHSGLGTSGTGRGGGGLASTSPVATVEPTVTPAAPATPALSPTGSTPTILTKPATGEPAEGPGDKKKNWFQGLLANDEPAPPPVTGPKVIPDSAKVKEIAKEPVTLSDGTSNAPSKDTPRDPSKVLSPAVSVTEPKPSRSFGGVKAAFQAGELYKVLNELEKPEQAPGLLRRAWNRVNGETDPKAELKQRFQELTGETYIPSKGNEYRAKFFTSNSGVRPLQKVSTPEVRDTARAKQTKTDKELTQTKDLKPRTEESNPNITEIQKLQLAKQAFSEYQTAVAEKNSSNAIAALTKAQAAGVAAETLADPEKFKQYSDAKAQELQDRAAAQMRKNRGLRTGKNREQEDFNAEDDEKAKGVDISLGGQQGSGTVTGEQVATILNTDTTRSTAAAPQDLSALRAAQENLAKVSQEAADLAEKARVAREATSTADTVEKRKARNQEKVNEAYRGYLLGVLSSDKEARKKAIKGLIRAENPYVDTSKDLREAKEYVVKHAAKFANDAYTAAKPMVRRAVKGTGVFAVKVVTSPYTAAKTLYDKSKKSKTRIKLVSYIVDAVVDNVKEFAGNVKEVYTTAKAVIKDTRIFKTAVAQLSSLKTGIYSAAEGVATSVGGKYASAMKLVNGIRYHAGQAYQLAAKAGAGIMKAYEVGNSGLRAIGTNGLVTGGLILLGTGNPLVAGAAALVASGIGTVNNLYNSTSKYSLLAASSHTRFFDATGRLKDLTGIVGTNRIVPEGAFGPMEVEAELANSMIKQGSIYSGWQRVFRAGNAGMFGAAIGTVVGGLLGGPALGAAIGFGVFAGGRAITDTVLGTAYKNLALKDQLLGSKLLGKIASLPYMSVLNSTMSNAWLIEQADIIRSKGIQRYMAENLSFSSPTNNFQAFLALSNYLGAIGYVQSSVALTNFLAAGAIRNSLGLAGNVTVGIRGAIFNPVTAGVLIGSTLGMFLSGYLFGFGTGTVIGATVGGIVGGAIGAAAVPFFVGTGPVGWISGIVIFGVSSFAGSTLGGWFGSLFNKTIDKGIDSVFGAINRISAMLKLLQILFSGAFQAGDMVTLTLALIPLLAALGKSGFNAANADCTDPEDCEDQNIASDNSQQQLAELELSYYNTKLLSETSAWTPSMMEIAIENLDRAGEQFYNQGRTIYLAIGGENIESYYDEKMIVVTIPVDIAYDQESFGASLQAEFGQLAQAINPGTSAMAN